MAEFVCHTPDHNKGGRVKMGHKEARLGKKRAREGKAEIGI